MLFYVYDGLMVGWMVAKFPTTKNNHWKENVLSFVYNILKMFFFCFNKKKMLLTGEWELAIRITNNRL